MWAVSSNWFINVTTAFLVTLPAVVGYVFALRLQKNERQEFWLRRQLQEEIARRIALQEELERQASGQAPAPATAEPQAGELPVPPKR